MIPGDVDPDCREISIKPALGVWMYHFDNSAQNCSGLSAGGLNAVDKWALF
jgi:hypothetical protein